MEVNIWVEDSLEEETGIVIVLEDSAAVEAAAAVEAVDLVAGMEAAVAVSVTG